MHIDCFEDRTRPLLRPECHHRLKLTPGCPHIADAMPWPGMPSPAMPWPSMTSALTSLEGACAIARDVSALPALHMPPKCWPPPRLCKAKQLQHAAAYRSVPQ